MDCGQHTPGEVKSTSIATAWSQRPAAAVARAKKLPAFIVDGYKNAQDCSSCQLRGGAALSLWECDYEVARAFKRSD